MISKSLYQQRMMMGLLGRPVLRAFSQLASPYSAAETKEEKEPRFLENVQLFVDNAAKKV